MNIIQQIKKNLASMVAKDQKLRNENASDEEIEKVDLQNRERFKEIFKEHGLIAISKFGEKASHDAWLLVQHFPETEINFMENYLELMKKTGDALPKDIAYLEDRVLMYKGLPQIYGTQLKWNEEKQKYVLWKLENEKEVDNLRKAIDLVPLDQYLQQMEE